MQTPLSRIVRARLLELGLSVDELITRSDLARSTIYSFLNDTRYPRGSTLRQLAGALGWTAAEMQAKVDGTPLVSPVADEQIARIVELLPSIPKDRLDAIEQHVTLAIAPSPRAKRRASGPDNSLIERRREALTGVTQNEPRRPKRRQFDIAPVQKVWEYVHQSLLAALGLNRDSGRVPVGA